MIFFKIMMIVRFSRAFRSQQGRIYLLVAVTRESSVQSFFREYLLNLSPDLQGLVTFLDPHTVCSTTSYSSTRVAS